MELERDRGTARVSWDGDTAARRFVGQLAVGAHDPSNDLPNPGETLGGFAFSKSKFGVQRVDSLSLGTTEALEKLSTLPLGGFLPRVQGEGL